MPTTLNFTVTTTARRPARPPRTADYQAWYGNPDGWKPGDPLYDPETYSYGFSRVREIFQIFHDHPGECIPGDNGECVYIGGRSWRWYPRKPALYQQALGYGSPVGPPETEFYGARIGGASGPPP